MNHINERYYFEEDMLRTQGDNVRALDMRGIMIPRVGDLLYYDTMDRLAIVEEVYDEKFYNERYIPIGVIANVSKDQKTLKLITPYIINIVIPTDKKRIQEKKLVKELKSYIRKYTKDILKEELEDLKFEAPTEKDIEYLRQEPKRLLNGIEVFSKYTELANNKQLDDIIKYDILLYLDKETIKILYGIIDIVNATDYRDEYEGFETKEIKAFDIKGDYVNESPTLKLIKELYPKLDLLSAYIIPFATIKLD